MRAQQPQPQGPPAGHVQQPGTYWTPSDPQQKVGGVLNATQQATVDHWQRIRAARAAQPTEAPMLTKSNRGIQHTQTETMF